MKQFYNNMYYANRPASANDKESILKFLELEAEIDRQNKEAIEAMDKSHLNKTKTNKLNVAMREWDKTNTRLKKHYKLVEPFSINRNRGWYCE